MSQDFFSDSHCRRFPLVFFVSGEISATSGFVADIPLMRGSFFRRIDVSGAVKADPKPPFVKGGDRWSDPLQTPSQVQCKRVGSTVVIIWSSGVQFRSC